jgi:hypothetical protein
MTMSAGTAMPGQAAALRPGDPIRLGPYMLHGRLGQGGMGTVYLGRSVDGPWVAIKMIRADYAGDAEFRARFRREADNARRVARFCTAAVVDADPDADLPYLVTEYVEGPTLAKAVTQSGPLRSANLEQLAVCVATALTAIHNAGVVHRDLTPANVLLSPVGPKVIDFGVARASDVTTLTVARDAPAIGTPGYMSPEQIMGAPVTSATDVFAWGGIVVYAATAERPFGAGTTDALFYRVLHSEPRLEGLEPALRAIVEQAMDKDPARRPTARALLMRLVGEPGTIMIPPGPTPELLPALVPAEPPDLLPAALPVPAADRLPAGPADPLPAALPVPSAVPSPAVAAGPPPAPRSDPGPVPPRTAARRRRRRTGAFIGAAAVIAAAAVTAGVLITSGTGGGVSAADRARGSRQVAAEADRVRATDPALARQLSLAAFRVQPTAEADRAMLASFAQVAVTRVATATATTNALALRPDGRLLAVAGTDRTIRLTDMLDPAHPVTVATLSGYHDQATAVVFSPDGRTLAVASVDDTVWLWDVSNPRNPTWLTTLKGHISPVEAVAFSPDGRVLATAGDDRTARLWNVSDLRHPAFLESLTGHLGPVMAVAFAPVGHTAVTASVDGTARLWNVSDPRQPALLASLTGQRGAITSVAFAADGRTLVTGGDDATARLWDVSVGNHPVALGVLADHTARVSGAAFAGGLLVTTSLDGTTDLYDATDVRRPVLVARLADTTRGGVEAVDVSRNGDTLATGTDDGAVRVRPLDAPRLAAAACADPANQLSRAESRRYLSGLPDLHHC